MLNINRFPLVVFFRKKFFRVPKVVPKNYLLDMLFNWQIFFGNQS